MTSKRSTTAPNGVGRADDQGKADEGPVAAVVSLPRSFTLGGSVAASAAGIDPFRSRVMAWAELTGRVSREESEAVEWGNRLEPVIDDAMTERGY